ncbi:MAG TPA: hypothetical protein VF974_05540 [Patescibacteria group bacterium]
MKKILMGLVVVLLLGTSGAAGYFYKQYDNLKKNPNKVAEDETKTLIAAVGKLILLPTGEQPTIATVTDVSKLKEQVFFANAKMGDKVLVYTQAKKAILYNPGQNKIVEVAPISIGNDTAAQNSQVSGSATTDKPTTNATK